MKPDMSPKAVGRRLRKVGELVRLCRALRIKPGSVCPVVGAEAGGSICQAPTGAQFDSPGQRPGYPARKKAEP